MCRASWRFEEIIAATGAWRRLSVTPVPAIEAVGGSISAEWVRRSHRGWAWLDEVGVPDDSFAEAYRVTLEGPAGSVVRETQQPSIVMAATDLPGTAGEELKLSVVTIGPKAVSRDISTTLIL